MPDYRSRVRDGRRDISELFFFLFHQVQGPFQVHTTAEAREIGDTRLRLLSSVTNTPLSFFPARPSISRAKTLQDLFDLRQQHQQARAQNVVFITKSGRSRTSNDAWKLALGLWRDLSNFDQAFLLCKSAILGYFAPRHCVLIARVGANHLSIQKE